MVIPAVVVVSNGPAVVAGVVAVRVDVAAVGLGNGVGQQTGHLLLLPLQLWEHHPAG